MWKTSFEEEYFEKKELDLFTGGLILPLRSEVDIFNKITSVYFYSLVLTSTKNQCLSQQLSGTSLIQIGRSYPQL